MSIEQRQHIRFSLDLPAFRQNRYGESIETILHQISIGGCLLEWDENIFVGDEFRLLARLPNKNFLPLQCKAVYVFPDNGIGVTFQEITQFEQELVGRIITETLREKGLPGQIDPFAQPKKYFDKNNNPMPKISDRVRKKEEVLEDILSINDLF
ncbi:MAG: PilZ domain-containing protein [Pyrinomonadaceae bacterium]